ncbi:hypothetical protein Tco_1420031 [Tanacetum coccineum]
MGFGTLLDFPFEKIPGKLPYFVVKNLDTKKMKVTFPSGSELKITPKKIWEVLGIPMGKNKLESDSPREYDDEFLKAFKEQFHGKKYITISDLSKQIQRTTNTDFMFQMNYLMLFSNCMIHYDNSSRLIYYLIYLHYTKIYGMVMMQFFKDDDNEDENEKDAEKRKLRELEHLLKEYTEMDELFSGDERLTLYLKKFKEEFTKGFRKDEERAGTSGVGNGDGNEDGADNNEVDVEEENEQTEMGIDAEISVKEAAEEKEADKASEMRQAAKKEAAEKESAEKEDAAKEKEEAEKIAAAKKKEQAEKLAAAKKEKAEKLAAAKKEQAEKLAAAKKKEEAEKLAAANKEQAEKLAATKKKEEAEKLAATKKKQAEKLAATKKKEEAEKKAAAEKEKAEKEVALKNDKKQLKKKASDEKKKEKAEKKVGAEEKEETEKKKSLKEAAEKKDAGTAQTGTEESKATTFSNTFESPKVQEKIFGKGQESADKSSKDEPKNKGKRLTKPSIYLKSPFMNKMVKTQENLDKDEILCARSIFCMQGDIRIKSGGKDKRRHYFPTNAHLLNKEKDEAKDYWKHLDNEKDCDYNKYKEVFGFSEFFTCVDKLIKEKPAKVLKFKWRTEKNKIDSDLYTIMHMELYQGESATKWKTDIVEENNRDYLKQMTDMRMRYTTKILMHEMNTKRGLMSEYANKFGEDNTEEEKVKKMVEEEH